MSEKQILKLKCLFIKKIEETFLTNHINLQKGYLSIDLFHLIITTVKTKLTKYKFSYVILQDVKLQIVYLNWHN